MKISTLILVIIVVGIFTLGSGLGVRYLFDSRNRNITSNDQGLVEASSNNTPVALSDNASNADWSKRVFEKTKYQITYPSKWHVFNSYDDSTWAKLNLTSWETDESLYSETPVNEAKIFSQFSLKNGGPITSYDQYRSNEFDSPLIKEEIIEERDVIISGKSAKKLVFFSKEESIKKGSNELYELKEYHIIFFVEEPNGYLVLKLTTSPNSIEERKQYFLEVLEKIIEMSGS